MAIDNENHLSNMFLDDDLSMDSALDYNSSFEVNHNHNKSTAKRPKPDLKCVVCGDHAFGKMNILPFF
jgi:hypothetical protein